MTEEISFTNYKTEFVSELYDKNKEIDEVLNFVSYKVRVIKRIMKIIEKNPRYYEKILDAMQRDLLINCYATSEKMLKEFVYNLIDFEKHDNSHLNRFLEEKVSRSKFSPDVKFGGIKKEVNKYFKNHLFIFENTKQELKSYDNLIIGRHTYAHNSLFNIEFDDFKEAIKAIEYIYFELYASMQDLKLQNDLVSLKTSIKSYKELSNKNHFIKKKKELKELRKLAKVITECKNKSKYNIQLFQPIFESTYRIKSIDFRKNEAYKLMNEEVKILKAIMW
ncbi:hypothetical protein K1Y25_08035 [Mammaliicoccus sciuri]|uniref:hypothetical protein n=1 Tax=Mammaliicoccus sciuri TaxID=1296 RepID=UPI001E3E3B63|nr:hypothetical protein [Mammaliicoccus sciuri]MCD8809195.1 hypothetical protein [Mammaliicoccus sciuri]